MDLQKIIDNINPVLTSHNIGEKRILFSKSDANTPITQIATTILNTYDVIHEHLHHSMDEHYIIISGECVITVNGTDYNCNEGSYLYIPAQAKHSIVVKKRTTLITIGVALD